MAVNRVEKLIINLDMQKPVTCAWDTCSRRARTSHQVRVHEHADRYRCDDPWYGKHAIYAFCSEGHEDYWLAASGFAAHETADRNRGLIYGQHSAGMKRSVI